MSGSIEFGEVSGKLTDTRVREEILIRTDRQGSGGITRISSHLALLVSLISYSFQGICIGLCYPCPHPNTSSLPPVL